MGSPGFAKEPFDVTRADVLVVDDDPAERNALKEFLDGLGFSVALASNGEDALSLCRRRAPAVLLLDLTMPHMDGWQLREALLADRRLAAIPVIVVSAVDESRQLPRQLVTVVPKPLDRTSLKALERSVTELCSLDPMRG